MFLDENRFSKVGPRAYYPDYTVSKMLYQWISDEMSNGFKNQSIKLVWVSPVFSQIEADELLEQIESTQL